MEVVELLRERGRQARAELAARTTLSNQALATILNDLVHSGYVVEVDTRGARRGRGRPALQYEYNAGRESVVALYIGLRYCEVALCDGLGRPIASQPEFSPGWDVDRVVEQASVRIADMLSTGRVDRSRCHIGVVVHGWVDTRAGTATSTDMGWDAVPIADLLAAATGIETTVHEASRAAAIAEYREGAAAGAHRAIVFNVGPEITATQVTDGVLDTGSGGFAGMVGRCPVPDATGRLGPIDALIGSFASKRRYIEASGAHVDWMSDVYALARSGDRVAREVLDLPIDVIGFATSWLITITNPERLVMTGAMGEYDEEMRSRVHSRIVELTDPRMLRDCSIHFSSLARQAWIRGGVHAALDYQRRNDSLTAG
jgi:glucokinase